jgi:hypothetical protein
MAASIRERIVQEVTARLSRVLPGKVRRQPLAPVTRDDGNVLLVLIDGDSPVRVANDRAERELLLRLSAVCRAEKTSDGWTAADSIASTAHAVIMADQSLGGLSVRILEDVSELTAESADYDLVAVSTLYRITYRTEVSDISQTG